ncbi:MAG: hypothetical protein KDK97_07370 [Verrucomicrobiales bacterium]|nr:hypothetical protein [Verrucomicrobiales bacterium]
MKTRSRLIALLFAMLASFTMPATARTPHGRDIIGIIQRVNPQTQEVEMRRDDTGAVITFVRVKRTTFVADGRLADATILKPGAHVTVSHHVPFFGKPFVTRVTLLPAAIPTK